MKQVKRLYSRFEATWVPWFVCSSEQFLATFRHATLQVDCGSCYFLTRWDAFQGCGIASVKSVSGRNVPAKPSFSPATISLLDLNWRPNSGRSSMAEQL